MDSPQVTIARAELQKAEGTRNYLQSLLSLYDSMQALGAVPETKILEVQHRLDIAGANVIIAEAQLDLALSLEAPVPSFGV